MSVRTEPRLADHSVAWAWLAPTQGSGEPGGQGWNGLGVLGWWGECSHQGQQAAAQALGPHSPREEGIREVLSATQTSWSLGPGWTKAGSTRVGHAVTWLPGWLPGQETMEPHTVRAVVSDKPKVSVHSI